jgi:hypothetical protein
MADDIAEIGSPPQAVRPAQHGAVFLRAQFDAPPAPARRQDGPSGAGPHAQAEPMFPGAPPVVRLESPLCHVTAPARSWVVISPAPRMTLIPRLPHPCAAGARKNGQESSHNRIKM